MLRFVALVARSGTNDTVRTFGDDLGSNVEVYDNVATNNPARAASNSGAAHPSTEVIVTSKTTLALPLHGIHEEPFETFKAEFRDCLHRLMAHVMNISQFTSHADALSMAREFCSTLSFVDIFRLPYIDTSVGHPRGIQQLLSGRCELFLLSYERLSDPMRQHPENPQLYLATSLPDHRRDTVKLFRQLLDILAKRYAPSTRHTPLLESITMTVTAETSGTVSTTPTSQFVLWSLRASASGGQNSVPRSKVANGYSENMDVPSRLQTTSADATIIAEEVPWLGAHHDGFERCTFEDYLSLHRASLERPSALGLVAIIQSQLTFGLIEAIVQEHVPESLLLERRPSGALVMTTRNLYSIIHKWLASMISLQDSNAEEYARRCKGAESTLWAARVRLDMGVIGVGIGAVPGLFQRAGVSSEDIVKITRMTSVIGEALTEASKELMDISFEVDWTLAKLGGDFHRDLATAGWCPSIASRLSSSACILEYAYTIPPFVPDDADRVRHHNCSSKICTASTINPKTYSNRHIEGSCKCPYSTPSFDKVIDILSRNQIPLISVTNLDKHGGGPLDLLCAGSDGTRQYVAISHVWADGLGSTTEKGLPTCQVRRLATIAHKLVPGGTLWLDALCIPAQDDMRKRALVLMARTYREASAILVLDSGIRSCSVKAPIKERLLRVVTSGWSQRMWTLQEALLAKRLAFEFSDGIMSFDELLASGRRLRFDPAARFLVQEFEQIVGGRSVSNFAFVSNALRFRATSKPQDEPLAIAGIFDVDARELVKKATPEERMMSLLLSIRSLPFEILFLQGAKLDVAGFKWAPRSLMQSDGGPIVQPESDATCTPDGLLVTRYLITFDQTTLYEGESLLNRIEDNIFVRVVNDDTSAYTCNALLPRQPLTPLVPIPALAVVVKNDVKLAGDSKSRLTCECVGHVLVTRMPRSEVVDTEGRIIHVQKYLTVRELCIT
ncbi:hypothetical protein OBBRIDRAFT_838307 [Obba rivulosa]|uniref:Heterokaryon incompatibility domain-containing protein n=1 Tax=Obba rivulosa TaxID=1052685 RepID=A0A8E2AMY7_9APHY|nr:hypothetical protein OBBRIDRAFT_838307 [Obba rivulosa]